ncbi:LytTR family transcriptional regulator DNA-binding domain-containing protein [Mesonia sp. MT50]|uniref:LytTR family transcriptional regulator DNA-binding domain-containing protein n=1 Tax=Mesonia profundi TaxID=3070998 RepID=A0ABU1A3P8_9FLAO|nr:LytTR family transcriptional regulator DNA-binding domain-containing protein [Mesonia profundi]MDQ7918265.1 LytTR family transcriptional regulator DNA-binding domain-containing protein [Mesonia profundi]
MRSCVLIAKKERDWSSLRQALLRVNVFLEILSLDNLGEAVDYIPFDTHFLCVEIIEELPAIENLYALQRAYSSSYIILISPHKVQAYTVVKLQLFHFLSYPLQDLELKNCLQKIGRQVRDKIRIRSYQDYRYILLTDILFLKADNNTTEFYLRKKQRIYGFKTLKTYQNRLPSNFLRIHKSYMVNASKICRIHFGKQTCEVKGHNHPLPFSKSYRASMQALNECLKKESY